jgi:hypothetical protein
MRTRFWTVAIAIFVLAACGVYAQQSQSTQTSAPADKKTDVQATSAPPAPSLADVARKLRDEKKSEPKPAKVFTNDNLPDVNGGVNVVGEESAPAPEGAAPAAPSAGNNEKMWRDRFAAVRGKLQRDQQSLDLAQRELGKAEVQYYPNDPTKQLMQSVTNSDIHDKQNKIAQLQQQVSQDQAAISDLEDQLRKSGGDPGWAR